MTLLDNPYAPRYTEGHVFMLIYQSSEKGRYETYEGCECGWKSDVPAFSKRVRDAWMHPQHVAAHVER